MSLLAQNERLARRVGAITLLVLGAAIVFFVFLLDKIEIGKVTRVRVYFASSAGIRENAAFVVGGQAIGHVEAIHTVGPGTTTPLGGDIGSVAVVAVDGAQAWKVPADAEVFVSSRGLLSERYLEVAPPRGEPGPAIRDGAKLRGNDPPSLDNVLTRAWANMTTFKVFVDAVGPEMTALRGGLRELGTQLTGIAADVELLVPLVSGVGPVMDETRALIAEARTTYEVGLGGESGIAAFAATTQRTRTAIAQLRATIDTLAPNLERSIAHASRIRGHVAASDPLGQASAALTRLRAAIDKLDPLLATVDDLATRFARHEGTIGRLMHDPEFPEDAKELGKILKRRPWRVIVKPRD